MDVDWCGNFDANDDSFDSEMKHGQKNLITNACSRNGLRPATNAKRHEVGIKG